MVKKNSHVKNTWGSRGVIVKVFNQEKPLMEITEIRVKTTTYTQVQKGRVRLH